MCSIHTRESISSGTKTDEVVISVSRKGETFVYTIHSYLFAADCSSVTPSHQKASEQHILPALSDTPKNYASLRLSTSRATICSPLLSPPWLPAACGHNTARRHHSTQCTAVRTSTRPAGSLPSSSPTLGRPRKRSRMRRKSVWRGHWLLSGLTLPERTEVGPVPNTQAQACVCASIDRQKGGYIDIEWLSLDSLSKVHFQFLATQQKFTTRSLNYLYQTVDYTLSFQFIGYL